MIALVLGCLFTCGPCGAAAAECCDLEPANDGLCWPPAARATAYLIEVLDDGELLDELTVPAGELDELDTDGDGTPETLAWTVSGSPLDLNPPGPGIRTFRVWARNTLGTSSRPSPEAEIPPTSCLETRPACRGVVVDCGTNRGHLCCTAPVCEVPCGPGRPVWLGRPCP